VEFGKHLDTVGFDIKAERLAELARGVDRTLETSAEELRAAARLRLTSSPDDLVGRDFYIVTVPTPVDEARQPDLSPVVGASHTVGKALRPGAIVIYESTVYPGCTEEVCVPILEAESGLRFNRDFFCGYSPERINPGDRKHRLTTILKVTSGSTPAAAQAVNALYGSIITAGTYLAPSIKVAEAAKVIENSQRDINIAFVNELAVIFHALGIDTTEVLEAAGTKWNFLPFRPGLVGGHCIGVDPYYLAHKAQMVGHNPDIILAGRRLNDSMGRYAASRLIKLMIKRGHTIKDSRVLVLGITFKENCPDIRNSKVIDVVRELQEFGCRVEVHDPWADAAEVHEEYGVPLVPRPGIEQAGAFDGIVLAVAHEQFRDFDIEAFRKKQTVVFDLKSFFDRRRVDDRL